MTLKDQASPLTNDDDLEVIVETGERLPATMFDPSMLVDTSEIRIPVFDGTKIVDESTRQE